jgi:cellulose synthase/poly-beta-1,6-N-acetylglucosamine synthase-like glycosyltransferase
MDSERSAERDLKAGYAHWWVLPVIVMTMFAAAVVAVVLAMPVEDLPLPDPARPLYVRIMLAALYLIIAIVVVNLLRHYYFTLNRLFGRQRHPYLDLETAAWPHVTILIPAHNEERVISDILAALLEVDYPRDRLRIMPLNDRSTDGTRAIIDGFASDHAGLITPFHREGRVGRQGGGTAGRPAAHHRRHRAGLRRRLHSRPRAHQAARGAVLRPEVGAVMGRVVPLNADVNLLTRLLDLERAGGYQVDQQARMNLRLVPQYGGTVGGIRRRAVEAVGGWDVRSLAEDTDITMRLLLAGWKTVYQNRSECYEQVPETWRSRMRQIFRWARGHNQVLRKYAGRLVFNRRTRLAEKIDGLLLLNIYLMSPIVVLGWVLGVVLWYLGVTKPGLIVILAVTGYSTLGNFAVFFEIAAATYLDGTRSRVRLLPFIMAGFLVSLMAVARATVTQPFARPTRNVHWHKTERSERRSRWV